MFPAKLTVIITVNVTHPALRFLNFVALFYICIKCQKKILKIYTPDRQKLDILNMLQGSNLNNKIQNFKAKQDNRSETKWENGGSNIIYLDIVSNMGIGATMLRFFIVKYQ
jgi:hypothetical protein